ncbi:MAG: IS66 family transposase [Candidatus Planktophila sp.]
MQPQPHPTHLEKEQLLAELEASRAAYAQALLERDAVALERDQLKNKSQLLEQDLYSVRYELQMIKKRIFGVKSEKRTSSDQDQLQMDFGSDAETEEVIAEEKRTIEVAVKKGKTKPYQTGRVELPESLERIDEVIEPVGIDLSEMTKIGEEVTEMLHYIPGELKVKRIIRPKYVNKKSDQLATQVHIAPLPKGHLDRFMATPELIAFLLVSKFTDHLPVHRLMRIFERHGIRIAHSTLSNWVQKGANLLIPLLEALLEEVIKSTYLMVDETPNRIIDRSKKENIHQGYYWVYRDPEKGLCFYDYQPTRSNQAIEPMLVNFKGYLQCDGYAVYKSLYSHSKEVKLVGCMAHIRRKFVECEAEDRVRSAQALEFIQSLYALEREFAEVCADVTEVKAARQQRSAPLMQQFKSWLIEQQPQLRPKSATAKAVNYALEMFAPMSRYLEDGRLRIDNNLVENSIRPVTLGRKNYMYAGSHKTARNAGLIYSLIESCRINNQNPYEYLVEMIKTLPDTNHKDVVNLLPNNYKKSS